MNSSCFWYNNIFGKVFALSVSALLLLFVEARRVRHLSDVRPRRAPRLQGRFVLRVVVHSVKLRVELLGFLLVEAWSLSSNPVQPCTSKMSFKSVPVKVGLTRCCLRSP